MGFILLRRRLETKIISFCRVKICLMSLKSIVPFIVSDSKEEHPQVRERILYTIENLGHTPILTDVGSIIFFEKADPNRIRVPWIVAAISSDDSNNLHLLRTLKAKFSSSVIIEAKINDLPRIIDEQRKKLSLWPDDSANEKVREITNYVYEQIHNRNLDLAFLANHFKTSIEKLESDFHKAGIKKGLWHLIIEIRITEAVRLLKETTLPAKEISYILGHEDYSSFTRSFKQFTGFSPSKIRKLHLLK